MSLFKRGRIWWCEWEISGQRIRETTGTEDREAAQEYHDRRRAEFWRTAKLGDRPEITWDQAALEWVDEHAVHKRSYEDDRLRLSWLTEQLTGISLQKITQDTLLDIRKKLSKKGVQKKGAKKKSLSPATVNRYLAVASAILNYAHEKGKIEGVPNIPYLPEPEGRIVFLSEEEAIKLIQELPPHLAAMTRFGLATGLRRSNITGLTWKNVDLNRRIAWVWPDEAKGKKRISVPLNENAIQILKEQNESPERHNIYIFTYRDKPVTHTTTKAWYSACERAGIEKGFTFHGLRHTWASWHVMKGTPLEVIQKLGAWADMTMVMRYAHLAESYVSNYVENCAFSLNTPHDFPHTKKNVSICYR